MWCTNCQQDVPAIAHGDMARCAQCGRFLKRRAGEDPTTPESAESNPFQYPYEMQAAMPITMTPEKISPSVLNRDTLPDDDWLLAEQVRRLQRRLRLDEAAPVPPPALQHEFRGAASELPFRSNSSSRRPPILAWIMIALGAISFVSDAALFAFALALRRNELWNFGLPLAMSGQFGLLLGLALQLTHLSKINRRTMELLQKIDHQSGQTIHHAAHYIPTQRRAS